MRRFLVFVVIVVMAVAALPSGANAHSTPALSQAGEPLGQALLPRSCLPPMDTAADAAPSDDTFAGLETGDFSELQMHQANNGTMAIDSSRARTGSWSARATVNGGVGAQYARIGTSGPWNAGDAVTYRASFFFPTGFFNDLTNQMDIMRFDNWDDRPTASEQTGLTINLTGSGKQLYLFRNQLGGGQGITYIAGPFPLPGENAWHDIEVRQILSPLDGSARNALYVDGDLRGASSRANMFGTPGNRYNRFRAGIVSSGQSQATPISLSLDNLRLTTPSTETRGGRWPARHACGRR